MHNCKFRNSKYIAISMVCAVQIASQNLALADTTKITTVTKTTTVKTSVTTVSKTPSKTVAKATGSSSAERGKVLFEKLTCAGCHPAGGNALHPYRPLKGPQFAARYKDDKQIEALIRSGVPRAGMPSFSKAQLNDLQIKDLVIYIRSFTPDAKK